jgi:dihydroorotate dehydrogenase electron transfer subunit
MKKSHLATIIENTRLTNNGYLMTIESKQIAKDSKPGQFLHIKVSEGLPLLRRPISICDVDVDRGYIKIFYLVVGEGTRLLSERKAGEIIDVLGPLGQGFDLEGYENPVVIGGGCGVAPMLYTAKLLKNKNTTAILGFRNETFLINDFEGVCPTIVTTEDGSSGIKGRIDIPLEGLMKEQRIDMVLACGPTPMLNKIKELCMKYNIRGQVSVEERMACGVGACLVCACKTKTGYERVCKDGPVFDIGEVELND